MATPDVLLRQPFLDEDYQSILTAQADTNIASMADIDFSHVTFRQFRQVGRLGRSSLALSVKASGILTAKNKQLADGLETPEQLDANLQHNATLYALSDQHLSQVIDFLALSTGYARARGDEEAVEQGSQLGEELVLTRGRQAATNLILESGSILYEYPELGLPKSVWHRTLELHKMKKARIPAIAGDAFDEYDQLRLEAYDREKPSKLKDIFKPSGSRIVTLVRGVRLGIQYRPKDNSTAGLQSAIKSIHELTQSAMSQPLAMDEQTIVRSLATLSKMRRGINSAALVDPNLALNPNARFFAYMLEAIGPACAVNTEKAAFEHKAMFAANLVGNGSMDLESEQIANIAELD